MHWDFFVFVINFDRNEIVFTDEKIILIIKDAYKIFKPFIKVICK